MPQLFEVFPHLETGMLVIKKMSEDDVCNAAVYIPLSWFFFRPDFPETFRLNFPKTESF